MYAWVIGIYVLFDSRNEKTSVWSR